MHDASRFERLTSRMPPALPGDGYLRSGLDALPGVAYDFCVGRGAKYPMAFLQGWSGTLVRD